MTQAIQNLGAIDNLKLPEGWVEEERGPHETGALEMPEIVRVFHKSAEPRAQICVFFRNQPVTDASAESFRKLLAAAPRKLTKSEVDTVQQVIGRMHWDEVFTTGDAKTEIVNEKTVLIVEGTWKVVDTQTYCMFVDITGRGDLVQEIYYAAPKDIYEKYQPEAVATLSKVTWIEQ